MGHVRLGQVPATKKWRQIIELLDSGDTLIAELAHAVEEASDRSLSEAVNDPGFVEALWLFLKVPQAARSKDFAAELQKIGLDVPSEPTTLDILAALDGAVDRARRRGGRQATDFSLIAKDAAIAALQSLTRERVPSLWASSAEDERTTLASFASTERFGELSQRFFTNLLEGHLQYFLDREIPRHIGRNGLVQSIADTSYFDGVVNRHCAETTVIMRAYARDWLGKNRFHLDKELSRRDVTDFASYAFAKIRTELSHRSVQ